MPVMTVVRCQQPLLPSRQATCRNEESNAPSSEWSSPVRRRRSWRSWRPGSMHLIQRIVGLILIGTVNLSLYGSAPPAYNRVSQSWML
jgi:hypothetical protein